MSKKNEMVYVVVRGSPDIAKHFVEIRGVFRSMDEARAWRQELWDQGERPQADIHHYFLRPIK